MNYFDGDTLHEECGVIGVYLNERIDAANYAYYGLYALQHRGQESAGITVNKEGKLESTKGMGLVSDVFNEHNLKSLTGNIAIGHVRYSTTGDKDLSNCQPLVAKYKHGSIALAHNGNLTNSEGVREMLEDEGVIFQSTTDSEAILNLIARHYNREMVIIDQDGLTSIKPKSWCQKKLCVFELIYLARPDSVIDGNSVYQFREKAGEILCREAGIEADVVIPVPDSGIPSAIGYSKASGIPFVEGFTKNRYIGRTFIQPTQEMRENAVRIKLNPLKHNIAGKRVVMTDDSIVRGTTCKRIVEQIRKAGATEVHVCITSPPVKYSCYFGIDTPDREKLVGAMMSIEEIKDYIGADSLTYLSLEGLKEACGGSSNFCRACFNGNYPMEVPLNPMNEEDK